MISRLCFALLVLVFSSYRALAETYSIETVSTGISSVDAEMITDLVSMNFKNEFGNSNQITTSDKATFKLKLKILKLDNLFIINLEKEKSGVFVFSSSIKSPKSDELDQKISKLLRSVVGESSLKDKVGEVTSSERDEQSLRRQSVNRWYLGFGPSIGRNLLTKGTLSNFTLGYNWEVNSQSSIRTFWDNVSDSGKDNVANFSNLGMGLQHYLNNDNNAPYVMGDLGWAHVTANNRFEKDGFSVGAGVGFTMFRTSSTNFDLLLRYQALAGANNLGIPSTFGLRIGVLF